MQEKKKDLFKTTDLGLILIYFTVIDNMVFLNLNKKFSFKDIFMLIDPETFYEKRK